MEDNSIRFHPLIAPYANSFALIIAGILGWRLISIEEFISLLEARGGNDRVALASRALEVSGENVTFSFRSSIQPLASGESDHHRLLSINAQQLIGHCWEILRVNGLVPLYNEPSIEFFRHVRNGCFHGNSFNLIRNEPRNHARWRNLEIAHANQGQRIFRTDISESEYFLNWGDPLLLLHDISQLI